MDEQRVYTGTLLETEQGESLHGYGSLRTPNVSYEGTWDNNAEVGRGTHTNGKLQYQGEFVNGVAHGFGIQVDEESIKYVGFWENGQRHGFGQFMWKDGRQYQGFFNNGNFEGKGLYFWANGDIYIGEFKNNSSNG